MNLYALENHSLLDLQDYLKIEDQSELWRLLLEQPKRSSEAWKLLASKSDPEQRDLLFWCRLLEFAVRLNWKYERDWAITEISKFKGCFYHED